MYSSNTPFGSEDCLYLNVYTPTINPDTPLPVMVFIHGGAFKSGSGNDDFYGPEFLIKHDVILVTINYRVEALGFLCLDTEDIPGNAGMKDQVAALRWVKENISNFGGDADNVTIFGESAGGGSVSLHLISPMSKGLFKRAIAQSGAATCWWVQAYEPREKALLLAKQNGFYSEDDKELYEFFKNLPVEKLVNLKLRVVKDAKLFELDLTVADEKQFGDTERFLFGDVCEAVRNGIHEGVEVMTGYTQDEGLMGLGVGYTLEQLLAEANAYKEFFTPMSMKIECPIKVQLEVARIIKKHYFKNSVIGVEDFDEFIRFMNAEMFSYGVLLFCKLCSRKSKVYAYKFTCQTERNIFSQILGFGDLVAHKNVVCHADDLMYLFPVKISNINLEEGSETAKIVDRVTKLWTNFAKFGNPTPDDSLGAIWEPYTEEEQKYMDLGNELKMKTKPDEHDMAVWDDVFKKYLPKCSG